MIKTMLADKNGLLHQLVMMAHRSPLLVPEVASTTLKLKITTLE